MIGAWYLLEDMFAFFRAALRYREDVDCLALSWSEPERVAGAPARVGLARDTWTVATAPEDPGPPRRRSLENLRRLFDLQSVARHSALYERLGVL